MDNQDLPAIIEALIFAAEGPLSLEKIREILDLPKKEVQGILERLRADYDQQIRGFTLVEVAEGWQFRTRPEYAPWIKKMKKAKTFALSQPALETLAVIAYKQPIMRSEIEKIRGVDSGGVLRTLLEKKLIKILGRKDIPGRPLVYGTSRHFLEIFGLKDLTSLPTIKEMESLGSGEREKILSANGLIDQGKENEPAGAGDDWEKGEMENELKKGQEVEINENLPETKIDEQSAPHLENTG
ncbi:MAG: SMC-Scp complex subunit ScpB [Thermodesulfobacteriota bacterium]